ncbi:MAG: hypothetical protein EPO01_01280 [Aquabacterium sp.]|nr:MAG: hypothetical protein EPO01_01280 [Aquabacterium sp.]
MQDAVSKKVAGFAAVLAAASDEAVSKIAFREECSEAMLVLSVACHPRNLEPRKKKARAPKCAGLSLRAQPWRLTSSWRPAASR